MAYSSEDEECATVKYVHVAVMITKLNIFDCNKKFVGWSSRPKTEDRINRKPDDRKNDQTTEKAKTIRPKVLF